MGPEFDTPPFQQYCKQANEQTSKQANKQESRQVNSEYQTLCSSSRHLASSWKSSNLISDFPTHHVKSKPLSVVIWAEENLSIRNQLSKFKTCSEEQFLSGVCTEFKSSLLSKSSALQTGAISNARLVPNSLNAPGPNCSSSTVWKQTSLWMLQDLVLQCFCSQKWFAHYNVY